MSIKKLVIGSKNPGKIKEWTKFLKDSFEIFTLKDFPKNSEPEEIGETFAENARLKASQYAKKLSEFVFSEDGGFEVDALGGLPGVHSRRILPGKKKASDKEVVEYVLAKLSGLPKEKRGARLKVAVAVSDPEGNIIFEDEGSIEGYVLEKADNSKIILGYPYRNLLFIPKLGKTYAQSSDEDHQKINHKKIISEKVKEFLLHYNVKSKGY